MYLDCFSKPETVMSYLTISQSFAEEMESTVVKQVSEEFKIKFDQDVSSILFQFVDVADSKSHPFHIFKERCENIMLGRKLMQNVLNIVFFFHNFKLC